MEILKTVIKIRLAIAAILKKDTRIRPAIVEILRKDTRIRTAIMAVQTTDTALMVLIMTIMITAEMDLTAPTAQIIKMGPITPTAPTAIRDIRTAFMEIIISRRRQMEWLQPQ